MRVLTGILAAGLMAGVSSVALAENAGGWYVGAETGLNSVPNLTIKENGTSAKSKYDYGYGVLLNGGYGFGKFGPGSIRAEGELGWRANGADKIGGRDAKGSLDAASLMANAYYDFSTGTNWTPYLGLGIGAADLRADKLRSNNNGIDLKDDSLVFAYQGIAGVSYALNEHLSLNADYRYFRTTEGEFKDVANAGQNGKLTYQAHSVLVGFTYKFGGSEKPVVAAAPMAAPAPAPAPAKPVQQVIAKSYLVFFDFDKSNITPEAQKIIEQAAANAKSSNATSIALTGHTDASGSEKYNMALSLRRANAVKAALVKLGIPENEISVVGKGKNDPLVSTKDGVKEPQNRRVQILLP